MGRKTFNFDWVVFVSTLILFCLGLFTLLSIDSTFFYQQLIIGVLSIALFVVFTRFDFSLYQYFDIHIYIICMIFLSLSFLGPEVRGATRWLEIGQFRLQPSELIKPFYLVSICSLLVKYPPTKIKNIIAHILLFIIPFLLIVFQPDLGNAVIYSMMWIGPFVLGGLPLLIFISGLLLVSFSVPLLLPLLRDYQRARIASFINPLLDPQGVGYNAIQSKIAVGSGQLWGRGFGRGTQSLLQFLPERHTDFIFASYVEEFGFIGGMILLVLFFTMLYRMLKKARVHLLNQFTYLYITGFFLQTFAHVVINIGMNVGLLPITGVTLPLVSYGRSSIVATFIGLGIYISALQKGKT